MKIFKRITAFALFIVLLLSMTSCNLSSSMKGEDGLSAYEIAVEEGFEGTLEEWLDSLKGSKGLKGASGSNGVKGKNGIDGKDGVSDPSALVPQNSSNFVIVSEYINPGSGKDVSNAIQEIINSNPGRTIFFPDGEYLISKPIKTSAKNDKSVSLLLSNYAQIKAMECWEEGDTSAMIMLGALENDYNNVTTIGSNYFLEGGIINGNGIANGIFIDGGRETRVEGVAIKNAHIGLQINYGVNNGSSDADIINVSITGNKKLSSIGVVIDAYDNTLENMRISGVRTGVEIRRGGNFLRDIHVTMEDLNNIYTGSIGFYCPAGGSWFDYCYTDNFEIAFQISSGGSSIISNCYAAWSYKNSEHKDDFQIARKVGFYFSNKFNSIVQNCKADFNSENTANSFLSVKRAGGNGSVITPQIVGNNSDNTYKDYLTVNK